MEIKKQLGSAKRFGSRYGRTMRQNFARIEAEQKTLYKCPYCNNEKVKRVSVGIWECRKCAAKFTGKAYTVPKKIIISEEVLKEEMPELKAEEKVAEEEKPKKYKEWKRKVEDTEESQEENETENETNKEEVGE